MFSGVKKYYVLITWLRKIVSVYFGQFLVFYFFTVANYDIKPIAFYYIFELAFLGFGFFLIRHAIKSNNRISYYRIGLSFQALYLACVMILKEKIIYFAPLVGIIQGLGEGFFYFPNNIMYPNIISDEERKSFEGYMNLGSNIFSIVVPFIVGYFLMFFDYVQIAKVFFCFMVLTFFLSFGFSDTEYSKKKSDLRKFWSVVRNNKNLKRQFGATFLAGLTFSSGALSLVVTIYTIFEFETSLNLGIITSVFAFLTCFCSYYFAKFMKEKHFGNYIIICTLLSVVSIALFGLIPCKKTILFYQFSNAICIHLMSLIFSVYCHRGACHPLVKNEFQTEYYLVREITFSLSRVTSYLLVLFVTSCFGLSTLAYSFYFFAFIILWFGIVLHQIVTKNAISLKE